MAYVGLTGNGTINAGQLVTFVAGPGIGRRSGREVGKQCRLAGGVGWRATPSMPEEEEAGASCWPGNS